MARPLSASQIALYAADPDEWRRVYLARGKFRVNPGHSLGADVHRVLARYLKGEADITPDGQSFRWRGHQWASHSIAARGVPFLPEPGAAAVERRFDFEVDGVRLVGIKDAELPGTIIDHKVWMDDSATPRAHDLPDDIQAAIYAAETFARTGAATLILRWVYYRADASRAESVRVIVTRGRIERTMKRVVALARHMEEERRRWDSPQMSLGLPGSL